ncbi:uncharacterized protein [Drosophila bipectinata]|uniref:uncharacterized protein n=1 Tax=Drosophila bipectinata TaxID=42026 RepID=UPI0038B3191E
MPSRELREAVRAHFRGVTLGDERFHLPATTSVVLGADMYPRIMQPGYLKIQDGLPVAQSTVFGWVVSEVSEISASSPIQNLNPFVDSQGLMRACGRVTSSERLQYDERHPIILPYDCHLSRLLVQFTHRITLHGVNQLMIRLIRAKFWIPTVRNLVKFVVYSCKVCVIHKKKLQTQLMGELPKERTSFSRPFTYTGVDYAGPFEIKNYTGWACLITKGYVLVIVCFSTKAIHLELTSDLTTEKFLAAFAGFVSRRGCPRQVQSDNGKTFVGQLLYYPAIFSRA